MADEVRVNHVWAGVLTSNDVAQVNGVHAQVDFASASLVSGVHAQVDFGSASRINGVLLLVDYEPASSSSGTDPAKRLRHGRTITDGVDSGHHTPG